MSVPKSTVTTTGHYQASAKGRLIFDSHGYVKRMTDGGFNEQQAEALATEQAELLGNLATRQDIEAVHVDVQVVRDDLEVVRGDLQTVKDGLEVVKNELEVVKQNMAVKYNLENMATKDDLENMAVTWKTWLPRKTWKTWP